MVNEELPDVPFYYVQDRLCALAKIATSKITIFRSAILNAGYRVSPLTRQFKNDGKYVTYLTQYTYIHFQFMGFFGDLIISYHKVQNQS